MSLDAARAAAAQDIRHDGVVAIVRARGPEAATATVRALQDGGCRAVEVSLSTPGALDAVAAAAEAGRPVGLGTVLGVADVRDALAAGAAFVVCPVLDPLVGRACADAGLAWLPGAMTPTEVAQAHGYGAALVKLFPASQWTPAALRDLRQALPGPALVPTGGVDPADAEAWFAAGVAALGIGSALSGADDVAAAARNLLTRIAALRR